MHLLCIQNLDQNLHELLVANVRAQVVTRLIHSEVEESEGQPHDLGLVGK